jgi:hypothetical protein
MPSSAVILSLISIASGAAIEKRDAVPAGYVAAPYYPCKLFKISRVYLGASMESFSVANDTPSSTRRMGV